MAGGGAFCLPALVRWLWGPRLFPSGYGDVPSNLPAGEAGKRQGPGSSSPFLLPPPFIPSPPSAAGFAAPPSRPVSPNSIQSPLHPIKRSLSSFFFFFVACRVSGSRNLCGGSSLGCSLVPTPSLGSGRHLWGAQLGRWRCLGRRGALLGSPRAVSARPSCLTRVSLSLCLTPLFHLYPPPSLRARRGGGSCLCGR